MHPAYSVIFFTTASGAGYGLLFLLGLFSYLEAVPADPLLGWLGFGLSLSLISAGLLSSTFHLGHPERAWRAFSQWRSSWLSREGVAAVFTYGPTLLFAYGWLVEGNNKGGYGALGLIAALGAVATVYCTSMIYASLRAIPMWANKWTVLSYLSLGLATGAIILNTLQHVVGGGSRNLTWITASALAVAWVFKTAYWKTHVMPVTAGSATGLGNLGEVTALSSPNTNATFVQREMGYWIARKHAVKLRLISVLTLFVLPILFVISASNAPSVIANLLSGFALLSAGIGIVVERWLFFAEAEHVVNLYYGK